MRIEVIKQLLDHVSLDMAPHYIRSAPNGKQGAGPTQLPADADRGGLADAAWQNWARTALPTGSVGCLASRAATTRTNDRAVRWRAPSPRTMAFAALGAADVLSVQPTHGGALDLLAAATVIGRPAPGGVAVT